MMKEPSSAVVHFYRAIVLHADVWRERLDATTNWAVVTTIGVISFTFSRADTPHFVLLFLIAASWLFLIMESRRYQIYDLWRRRIRSINQYIIAPRLAPDQAPATEEIERGLAALARDLGRAVPHLRFVDALGYRIRRNYGFIFLFTVGSWLLKLFLHPEEATNLAAVVERAELATISGSVVVAIVGLTSVIILFLGLRAPSEQMVSWRRIPSPLSRLRRGSVFPDKILKKQDEELTASPGPSAPRPLEEFFPGDESGPADGMTRPTEDETNPETPDSAEDIDPETSAGHDLTANDTDPETNADDVTAEDTDPENDADPETDLDSGNAKPTQNPPPDEGA